MTPNEKAAQLVVNNQIKVKSLEYTEAVQCAIVTVDEIIEAIDWYAYEIGSVSRPSVSEVGAAILLVSDITLSTYYTQTL